MNINVENRYHAIEIDEHYVNRNLLETKERDVQVSNGVITIPLKHDATLDEYIKDLQTKLDSIQQSLNDPIDNYLYDSMKNIKDRL